MPNEYYKKPDETIEEYYQRTPTPDKPGDVITTDSLTNHIQSIDFQTEPQIPIPSIKELTTDFSSFFQPSEAEKEKDIFSSELEKITASIAGEPTFRAEQEKEQDILGKKQAVTDLSEQLKSIQAEEKQLMEQQRLIPLQVQETAQGRFGMAGVQQITSSQLRQLSIRQGMVASRGYSVSAALQAQVGNLANAQEMVENAIKAEFDPKKAELEVLKVNIDNIYDTLDREDKRRADATKLALNERERLLDEQENTKKGILDIYTTAASRDIDALTLRNILNSRSIEEATAKAGEAGVFAEAPEALKTQVVEVAGRKKLINTQTGETIQDLGVVDIPSDDDTTQEAVDAWARRINSGTDKISSVPSNIRNQVITKMKDFAEEDLTEDIQIGLDKNIKKEDLISQLKTAYPEFSKTEIKKFVETATPTEQVTEEGGGLISKIGTFFGSLFR